MRLFGVVALLLAAAIPARAAEVDDLRGAVEAAIVGQHDEAIALYSRALESRSLSETDRMAAYLGRALEYKIIGANDKSVGDYGAAIHLGAGYYAYEARGQAERDAGRLDRAIADFDVAIAAAPNPSSAYLSRAGVWRAKGQFEKAIADFDAVIRLDSESYEYPASRGKVNFLKGDYERAAHDFTFSLSIARENAAQVLWLHLARLRTKQDDRVEFTQNAARVDLNDWPGPVVGLHLGRRTVEAVLDASRQGNADERRLQACEAPLHLGLYQLGRGAVPAARTLLRAASQACAANEAEADIAKAELARLPN